VQADKSQFISEIRPQGILSFANDAAPVKLHKLNLIIGPNGSGKSNFIEIFELLSSAPTDLARTIRDGGGVREWLWKGESPSAAARVGVKLSLPNVAQSLRYELELGSSLERLEILDEKLEDTERTSLKAKDVYFYYRFQRGHPVINVKGEGKPDFTPRKLNRESLDPQQSVLSQRKDPEAYPEVTSLGREFGRLFTFREWRFGRYGALRQAQPADLPTDMLMPDAQNLALILNGIEHSDQSARLNDLLVRFLPRFKRISTRVQAGGALQIFLHENGLSSPIPATRLSDGTIRFIALLVILLKPELASAICIEEPELGLHPDALFILAELISEASQRTQIVVTTHSEVLLSEFSTQADDVLICENVRGKTSMARLPTEKLNFWLDKYSLGEIWRNGEIGGNP
jgi:predicted ATPase